MAKTVCRLNIFWVETIYTESTKQLLLENLRIDLEP